MAKIMVVEDEPEVAEVIGAILESDGHEVLFPVDPIHPSEDVVARSYDLLLTDVVMPETSAGELIRLLRLTRPGLPVIALSGGDLALTAKRALRESERLGAEAVLQKPIGADDLLQAIALVLERRLN